MSKLKIDDVVSVSVSTAGAATAREGFNVALIVGSSEHIATADRCKTYASLEDMTDDGFLTTDSEYLAAKLYFAQDPAPQKLVVGVKASAETWVEAVTACREKNGEWYAVYCASDKALTTAEHSAVAAYVEGIIACYFFDDSTAEDLNSVETDVFSVMKAGKYRRTFGLYSATKYAAAAAMGYAMGANDGTDNSAFTMAYKALAGVTTDELTETQVSNLRGKNANYYVSRGASYSVLETGVNASGAWFDEVLGLDQLANDIQLGCMDVLTNTKSKIPYTDAGALQFVLACNEACEGALNRGFVAPGVWEGETVLNLEKGDTLESGYLCQAVPVNNVSAADRAARICPPIYVCVRLAGAIHYASITVFVE